MIVLRYIGYALSSCAVLLLGFEIVKYLETKSSHLLTIQQVWRGYHAEGLEKLNKAISEGPFPGIWQDVVESFINLPLLAVIVMISAFLLFISRHGDMGY